MQAARIWALLLGLTAIAASAFAVEQRSNAKSKPDTSPAAARQFAENLYGFVKQVEGQYVRIIPEEVLFAAALAGMYDAAKEPMPAEVRNEIARIGELSRKIRWLALPTAMVNRCAQPPMPQPQLNLVPSYVYSLTSLIAPFDRLPQPRWFVPWASMGLAICDIPRTEWQDALYRARKDLGTPAAFRDQSDLIASIRSLSQVLDPYSGFAKANEFTNSDENQIRTGVEFDNLPAPIVLDERDRLRIPPKVRDGRKTPPSVLLVKTVVPGGPGQTAGLRPGDMVERVNDRPISDMTWPQVYAAFYPSIRIANDELWTEQRLTVRRPGREGTRIASLGAATFRTESVFGMRRRGDGSWDHQISPGNPLMYVRIGAIGGNTHTEVVALLEQITKQGLQGIVLDLRWCPGGFLTPAKATAQSFLNENKDEKRVIVRLKYRDRREEVEKEVEKDKIPHFPNLPIVVLINNDTRGGGEMIAAALQDNHRAVLVGERTFGKASIQQPLEPNPLRHLSNGNSDFNYRITVGTFLRPNGKNLQRFPNHTSKDDWGVQPDDGRLIPLSPALSEQLKTWWTWHVLRPAGSSEALPTDDPEFDPQVSAAIQMLKQMTAKAKS